MAGQSTSPPLESRKEDAYSDLKVLGHLVMGFRETEKMEFNFRTIWKLIFFGVNHYSVEA
jgi:hypothetical protein